MTEEIRITAEPIDNQRCKFVLNVPVLAGGVRRFTAPDDAKGSPLAEAIFAIPGLAISELIVSGNIITVVKQSSAPWQAVGKPVGVAIRTALASDVPPVAASPKPPGAVNDDALYEQVALDEPHHEHRCREHLRERREIVPGLELDRRGAGLERQRADRVLPERPPAVANVDSSRGKHALGDRALDDATRAGLKKYQEAEGLKITGTLNKVTLEKMAIVLTDKQKTM